MANDISIITKTITENKESLILQINKEIVWNKERIIQYMATEAYIRYFDDEGITHYEWVYDGCPWDYSGVLKEKGVIEPNIPMERFCEKEYTGASIPTFVSRYGLRYETYGEELWHYASEAAFFIQEEVLKKFAKKEFDGKIPAYFVQEANDLLDGETLAYDSYFNPDFLDGVYAMTVKEFFDLGSKRAERLSAALKEQGKSILHGSYELFLKVEKGESGAVAIAPIFPHFAESTKDKIK